MNTSAREVPAQQKGKRKKGQQALPARKLWHGLLGPGARMLLFFSFRRSDGCHDPYGNNVE